MVASARRAAVPQAKEIAGPAGGGPGRGAPGRSRLDGAARRAWIVDAAAEAFAALGFGVSTREIARRLNVTQALLYRYFPAKNDLVEAVVGRFRRRVWPDPAPLLGLDGDLGSRLTGFYLGYLRETSPVSLRLFLRANLDGLKLAPRFGPPLTEHVLRPVIAALRAELGLPDLAARGMMRGERELAMALHGGLVFLAIRRHVYGMDVPDPPDELVALQVRAFLPGALNELRRLHGLAGETSLTVAQLRPRRLRP
jgi:AcrR family transcriptional regulator